jgi:hypothetical protein
VPTSSRHRWRKVRLIQLELGKDILSNRLKTMDTFRLQRCVQIQFNHLRRNVQPLSPFNRPVSRPAVIPPSVTTRTSTSHHPDSLRWMHTMHDAAQAPSAVYQHSRQDPRAKMSQGSRKRTALSPSTVCEYRLHFRPHGSSSRRPDSDIVQHETRAYDRDPRETQGYFPHRRLSQHLASASTPLKNRPSQWCSSRAPWPPRWCQRKAHSRRLRADSLRTKRKREDVATSLRDDDPCG